MLLKVSVEYSPDSNPGEGSVVAYRVHHVNIPNMSVNSASMRRFGVEYT